MRLFAHLPANAKRFGSAWAAQWRVFLLAASFLTRLAPAQQADAADMSRAVLYYPAAGAVLGLLLVLPFVPDWFACHPLVQAWCYVLLSVWLTRALHLDGLADVLDALGSGRHGEDFQTVLKDSRVGAFGVTGLILALAGQLVAAAALFETGRLEALFFAPLYGRCLPVVLASLAGAKAKTGLGALLAATPKKTALALAALGAFGGGWFCLGGASLLLCLLLTAPCLLLLVKTAHREGGYNGDFLGFAIVAGELCALLAAVPGV